MSLCLNQSLHGQNLELLAEIMSSFLILGGLNNCDEMKKILAWLQNALQELDGQLCGLIVLQE